MCKRKYGQNHLFAIKKVKGKFKAITTYERHKNMHVWCYVKAKALETSKEIDETSQIFHTDMNSNENILTSTHLYSNHSSDFNPSDTINDKSYPKVCEDCTFTGGNEALNGVIKAFQCGFDREKVNKLNLKVNKESINLLNNNSEKINNSNLKEYKENSNFLNNESNNIRNITLEDDIFDLSEINQVKDLSCDFNELSFYETDLHIFEQIMDDTLINNNQTNAVEEIKDLESCNDQKIEQLDCADIVEEEIDNKDENYIPESESEYSDIEYESSSEESVKRTLI
ncbi:ras-related protein RabX-like isoform X2 [Prorops nasuta]|uniref:ras-related protein RabX-like isoform X2 n=1 Tax=Prorops nasuta TaxID=863751 RepID=UPI0034CEC6AD